MAEPTTNVTLRLDTELVTRIDAAAEHAGQTRTAYILRWLPETYEQPRRSAETGQHSAANGTRKAPTRGERLARTQ